MKKRYLFPAVFLAIIFLGPTPNYSDFEGKIEPLELDLITLDETIAYKDANVQNLKPNNESRLIWADSIRKTPYAVVYLHGFSASPMEGYPTHQNFAKRYGCNIYIPRLPGHGLDDKESFLHLEPKDLINAAKEAIAVGKLIGEKIILMSCSTGSTLAIYLAAENPDDVETMIMYSPNIDLENQTSELITLPWGLQIIRAVAGKYRHTHHAPDSEAAKYTTNVYRTEGVICLKELIEKTMTDENFKKITCPYFLGYYYKNETEKDHVVSVDDMIRFDQLTSTPVNKKRMFPFPNVKTHVVPSEIHSKDLESVQQTTYQYAEEVLGMIPVENNPIN
jgi:pimeloyl-ACP methyl ester carboxylesterase